MTTQEFKEKATTLIDDLKGVCANYGLGNDGNEFKIITQVFLYKFLNDKFAYEVKKIDPAVAKADSWEEALREKSEDDYELLLMQLDAGTARLKPEHFLATLWSQQNDDDFADAVDKTLIEIAAQNTDIFSVKTNAGEKIILFDAVTRYVTQERDEFAKAIINKLIPFSFEHLFSEKFDFYATLFEYLIKDYNKDGGGKYAEYYTPHAVAKIMAACLVPKEVENVTCYDPAAGSGQLLMNLAHTIGEDRCTLYTEDISQKSSSLLRLNLILNNLVHSIPNVIQGNTILSPYRHKERPKKFNYIVSIRLSNSTSRIGATSSIANRTSLASSPESPRHPPKRRTRWQSIFSFSSTSSTHWTRMDEPPLWFQPASSPPNLALIKKSANTSSRTRCSVASFHAEQYLRYDRNKRFHPVHRRHERR